MTKVTIWGCRGSLASPGGEFDGYGGNTSCVEVTGSDGTTLVLDAGTGILGLGRKIAGLHKKFYLLLTHLHMDHLQGMGFFSPFFKRTFEGCFFSYGFSPGVASIVSGFQLVVFVFEFATVKL